MSASPGVATKVTGTPGPRVGAFGLTMIVVAYAITLNNFTVGATVGHGLDFPSALLAAAIAWVLLSILWIASGTMGSRSRLTSVEIWKRIFGTSAFRIPSLVVTIIPFIFAFFDFWYVGAIVSNMLPDLPHLGFVIGIAIVTACAIVGTIKDIMSLKWLTITTVPVALVLFVIILVATINASGGVPALSQYLPTEHMSLFGAVNLIFASFIGICGPFSDITSSATSSRAVKIAMPLGMLVVAFQVIVGSIGAQGLAIVDFTSLAIALGGPLFFVMGLFVVVAQGNTVPSNTFIMGVQLSSNFRIPRIVVFIGQPLVAAGMAFFIQYVTEVTILAEFVGYVGIVVGPLLAVTVAEYWIVRKGEPWSVHDRAFHLAPLVSLAVGVGLGAVLRFAAHGLPETLICFPIVFVFHLLLRRILTPTYTTEPVRERVDAI